MLRRRDTGPSARNEDGFFGRLETVAAVYRTRSRTILRREASWAKEREVGDSESGGNTPRASSKGAAAVGGSLTLARTRPS